MATPSSAVDTRAFTKERVAFKTLLLTNPNYFGNLIGSDLQVVLPIKQNRFYEQLGCVGYHPQQEQLEAVVHIKQPSGYGTDVCGAGTTEFVRFYLSFDDGASWIDQGMTSFQAYNIPEGTEGGKQLEYAVSLKVDPTRKLCLGDHTIKMRGILSWNNPPPANQPDWSPVWGDRRDADIFVEPRRFWFPPEIFKLGNIELKPEIAQLINLEHPVPVKQKVLAVNELAELYKDQDVPAHRFAFKQIASFATAKGALSAEAFVKTLPGIKFDPGIFDILFPKTDGNTSFEELKCIGLDPNHPNMLIGIIQLKKRSGYSGGPCTDGSREYVTFWGDADGDGSFETCFGTAEVRVYDFAPIPDAGIHVAVRLPVDLNQYRQACEKGARLMRIRAILSWNDPVACAEPNKVPPWGNREETVIHIATAALAPAGKIAILGGIPTSQIDDITGLTTPDAKFALNNIAPDTQGLNRACPFARRVSVQGFPLPGHSYKVEVRLASGGVFTEVVNDLELTNGGGGTFGNTADPATKRFNYVANVANLLGLWDSGGDALWEVKLTTYNGDKTSLAAVPVGTDTHLLQLRNTGPDASIEITTGTGDCGRFGIGELLGGNFVARDVIGAIDYLSHYGLDVEPNVNPAGVGVPTPGPSTVSTPAAPGLTWELDTAKMKACGYIIRVSAVNLSIVNSATPGLRRDDSAGFCLLEV